SPSVKRLFKRFLTLFLKPLGECASAAPRGMARIIGGFNCRASGYLTKIDVLVSFAYLIGFLHILPTNLV
ncbi:hypothetical protein, partial [Rheinheimera metallidurans]|uniref:hypothetical protein n=1 Tax=Rheinheimera metallidurans TaxID=2925781 RepID=UPI003001A74A